MNRDNPSYREVLWDLITSNFDSNPTKNEEYAEQLMNVHVQFVKRNGKLTDLLDDYIEQRRGRVKTNNFLKKFIFWFFIVLLGILTIAVAIFIICNRNSDSIPAMVSLLSVSVTYLASLIAVFEIMSKYLFPIDEEKDTISMIQAVINNDVQVEELMSNAIDKNHSEVIERLKMLKQLCDDKVLTDEEFNEIKKNLIEKLKEK
ncbi:MAG: SHOCT domain-containing protein [Oscillospiraceae bacterium]|nr:SHOCT domain-containing protein [Oscillospiraceae bacterium]